MALSLRVAPTGGAAPLMQLQKIQAFIAEYRQWLASPEAGVRIFYWETQALWQAHWDINAPDLRPGFEAGLENSLTRRLWNRQAYEPKRMMLAFMEMEPEFVRSMFIDLFNEQRDAVGRADRFVFYCDQLIGQYRERNPLSPDTRHYHDDGYGMISLYLSFQYPTLYAPYRADRLAILLNRLGSKDLPTGGDFERYTKVMRTLWGLLQKDAEVISRHTARLLPGRHYTADSLLLAFDFACFITGETTPISQP